MATSAIMTFESARVVPLRNADECGESVVNLKVSTSFSAGTLLGEITASPGTYGPYASGNSDGTQNPTLILEYQCTTDASGNVTFGSGTNGGEWGQTEKGAPCWRNGLFNCADLVGLDANAVTKLGRLIQGTVSAGIVEIYGQ